MALTILPAIDPPTDAELDAMALDGLLADLRTLPEGTRAYVRADLLICDVLIALGWPAAAVERLGLPTDERMAA